jgi:ectoine hydroxylase-related dioxygenase (phytanoyl-CoA dioxygenase family)
MPRGSVLCYSGTVIHGGGQNRSDAARIGLNITYCLGWLRQEENQFLSCPPQIARTLEPAITDLLGYTMGNYALGYYSNPEMVDGLPDTLPPEIALGRSPEAIPGNTLISGGPTAEELGSIVASAGQRVA